MATAPIQPIQASFSNIVVSQSVVLEAVFVLIFFVWAIYTIVIIYHWLRYGHRSVISIPIIIVHLLISAGLFLLAISGFI